MSYNLYTLNPPPNPFFEFVDHPFFRGPPAARGRFAAATAQAQPASTTASNEKSTNNMNEKAGTKQVNFEDPPEVDPSTVRPEGRERDRDMPFRLRGRGRFARAFDNEKSDNDQDNGNDNNDRRHRRCGGGRRAHFEHAPTDPDGVRRHRDGRPCRGGMRRDGPPFMMGGGHPFFGNGPFPFGPGPEPEHGHGAAPDMPPHPPVPGAFPEPHHPGGPAGRPGHPFSRPEHPWYGRRHEHPHGPHRRHGHEHERGPRRPFPFNFSQFVGPTGPAGFDLPGFLENLSTKIGVDLTAAAESLGVPISKFTNPRSNASGDYDFEPATDIFESSSAYTIHLSLPGAKKSDVGVDWDGENSHLRVTGVVHRPDVNEEMLSQLIVDGRKREVGVFEKIIRLGTREDPAAVEIGQIEAKMVDGVLVINVPKSKNAPKPKTVQVNAGGQETGFTDYQNDYSEKPDVFFSSARHEDEEMYDAHQHHSEKEDLIDMHDNTKTSKGKQAASVDRESTLSHEKQPIAEVAAEKAAFAKDNANKSEEHLPAYRATPTETETEIVHGGVCESDDSAGEEEWEKFDSEGEGEFVKINVK